MSKNSWTNWLKLVLVVAIWLWGTGVGITQGSNEPSKASLAFERLKTLVGSWEAKTNKGKVLTSFELISGGTAILERDNVAQEAEMITVYHLDADRLILTHYCMAGNQPRMQARPFDPKSNEIHFDFVGATNLTNPEAGHMYQVVLKFGATEELTAEWTWYENGKTGFTEPFLYHRVR